jgi:hypothetical protein
LRISLSVGSWGSSGQSKHGRDGDKLDHDEIVR